MFASILALFFLLGTYSFLIYGSDPCIKLLSNKIDKFFRDIHSERFLFFNFSPTSDFINHSIFCCHQRTKLIDTCM